MKTFYQLVCLVNPLDEYSEITYVSRYIFTTKEKAEKAIKDLKEQDTMHLWDNVTIRDIYLSDLD